MYFIYDVIHMVMIIHNTGYFIYDVTLAWRWESVKHFVMHYIKAWHDGQISQNLHDFMDKAKFQIILLTNVVYFKIQCPPLNWITNNIIIQLMLSLLCWPKVILLAYLWNIDFVFRTDRRWIWRDRRIWSRIQRFSNDWRNHSWTRENLSF